MVGYLGLTVAALLTAYQRRLPAVWRLIVVAIVVLVYLVWEHFFYGWHLTSATRNGYAGFLLFHGALIALIVSTVVSERLRNRLLWASYFIVSMGAAGAVFRDARVAVLSYVVISGSPAWRGST